MNPVPTSTVQGASPGTPSSRATRWLVIGGTVSPYLPELWSSVGSLGDEVLFVSAPRQDGASFEHERSASVPRGLHWVQPEGFFASLRALRQAFRFKPNVVVGLGYTRPLTIAALLAFRVVRRSAIRVLMGDSNVVLWLSDAPRSFFGWRARLRRILIGVLFQRSFDLGWTNELANRSMGLVLGARIPLYAIDFTQMERAELTPALRAHFEQLPRPVLVCIARLVSSKNLRALVSAWKRHSETHPSGALVIVGEGNERHSLERDALSCGRDRLRLIGAVPRAVIGAVLRQADALVLPSTREPWGIVVVEALGLGRPVLATRYVGAAVSLATENAGGMLLGGATAAELELALERFVRQLPSLSEAARASASSIRFCFDRHHVAERLLEWARMAKSSCTAEPPTPER